MLKLNPLVPELIVSDLTRSLAFYDPDGYLLRFAEAIGSKPC
jgi:hypothetical protein